MTDREYLESVWTYVALWRDVRKGCWTVNLGPACLVFDGATQEDALAAAAAFTRSRMEEIRQVRKEIDSLESSRWGNQQWQGFFDYLRDDETMGDVVLAVRQKCAEVRILARVQAALDALCVGIKPEALK